MPRALLPLAYVLTLASLAALGHADSPFAPAAAGQGAPSARAGAFVVAGIVVAGVAATFAVARSSGRPA